MSAPAIRILSTAVHRPGPDGKIGDDLLVRDRRSPKVGALSEKMRFLLAATGPCLGAAGGARPAIGVSLGTLLGAGDVAQRTLTVARQSGFVSVTPSWYATGLANAATAIVASFHDLQGPNLTFLGYQSGIDAIIMACRMIRGGRAPAMLAGGFDWPGEGGAVRFGRSGGPVQPAAGLVLLDGTAGKASPGEASGPAILGWSQGWAGSDGDDWWAPLVDRALAGTARAGVIPTVHLIRPSVSGVVDYLAAGAPVHLADVILAPGSAGAHALVVRGWGPAAACLLVEAGPACGR